MSNSGGSPLLHELDGRAVRVTHIDDALARVRAARERLWFTGGLPTAGSDLFQNRVEVIDNQSNVDVSDVACPKIDMFLTVRRREIFEQFDLMATRHFHHGEFDLSALHTGDLLRHFAGLMSRVRKFEPEHIAPESERPLQ